MAGTWQNIAESLGLAAPDYEDLYKSYRQQTQVALDRANKLQLQGLESASQAGFTRFGGLGNPGTRESRNAIMQTYGDTSNQLQSDLTAKLAELQAAAKATQRERLGNTIGTVASVAGLAAPFLMGPAMLAKLGVKATGAAATPMSAAGPSAGLYGAGSQTALLPQNQMLGAPAYTMMDKLGFGQNLGIALSGLGKTVMQGQPQDMLGSLTLMQKDQSLEDLKDMLRAQIQQLAQKGGSYGNPYSETVR